MAAPRVIINRRRSFDDSERQPARGVVHRVCILAPLPIILFQRGHFSKNKKKNTTAGNFVKKYIHFFFKHTHLLFDRIIVHDRQNIICTINTYSRVEQAYYNRGVITGRDFIDLNMFYRALHYPINKRYRIRIGVIILLCIRRVFVGDFCDLFRNRVPAGPFVVHALSPHGTVEQNVPW